MPRYLQLPEGDVEFLNNPSDEDFKKVLSEIDSHPSGSKGWYEENTVAIPPEVRNIKFGSLYDISRFIEKNPTLDFLAGGIADYMKATAKGEGVGFETSLMAALDMPGPGEMLKAGKLSLDGLVALGGMVKAFHGSPHKFDKFSMDKIGTGEGVQSYGHGLYFAENPKVAGEYARKSDNYVTQGDTTGKGLAARLINDAGLSKKDAILELERRRQHTSKNFSKKIDEAVDAIKNDDYGSHLYNVKLDVNKEDLLDWDKPLSEQSESVQAALKKAGVFDPNKTGAQLVRPDNAHFGPDGAQREKATSEWLNSIGIPGIKYLDQGSRGAEKGTHNIVVFDDKLIDIINK